MLAHRVSTHVRCRRISRTPYLFHVATVVSQLVRLWLRKVTKLKSSRGNVHSTFAFLRGTYEEILIVHGDYLVIRKCLRCLSITGFHAQSIQAVEPPSVELLPDLSNLYVSVCFCRIACSPELQHEQMGVCT